MEISISKEDLSQVDCGGGLRDTVVRVTIDKTLPLIAQRRAVAYEVLSAYLDPNEHNVEYMTEIANDIAEGIDELEAPTD